MFKGVVLVLKLSNALKLKYFIERQIEKYKVKLRIKMVGCNRYTNKLFVLINY